MIERRQNLRFTVKTREAFGIGGDALGQNLDCQVAIELRVPSSIHLAHLARTNGAEKFVRAEAGAGLERQRIGLPGLYLSAFQRLRE